MRMDGHGRSKADSAVTAAGHGPQPATGPTVASATVDSKRILPYRGVTIAVEVRRRRTICRRCWKFANGKKKQTTCRNILNKGHTFIVRHHTFIVLLILQNIAVLLVQLLQAL